MNTDTEIIDKSLNYISGICVLLIYSIMLLVLVPIVFLIDKYEKFTSK